MDSGNVARLGTDSLIYVPTPTAGQTGSEEVAILASLPTDPGLELWVDPSATAGPTLIPHSSLQGLGNDDHQQYYNQARGDTRYLQRNGDSMQGPLFVQPPTDGSHAARNAQITALQGRSIIAGNGLTGGGDLSADRMVHVGAGTGISVAADLIALDTVFSDGRYVLKSMLTVSTAAASGAGTATGHMWVQY